MTDTPDPAPKSLAPELKKAVSESVALLGICLREEYGEEVFELIEKTRVEMKKVRNAAKGRTQDILANSAHLFSEQPSSRLYQIAHGYTLMLELMNVCENAYRTYRYQAADKKRQGRKTKTPPHLTYVLTAHPTEAREPYLLHFLQKIQQLLTRHFEDKRFAWKSECSFYLRLLTKRPLARSSKPQVEDEANHIYQVLFQREVFENILDEKKVHTRIRTWVGGDKDGNPFVTASKMRASLEASRARLILFVEHYLKDLQVFFERPSEKASSLMQKKLWQFQQSVQHLKRVQKDDGAKIKKVHRQVQALTSLFEQHFQSVPLEWSRIQSLFNLFPALVVPLELREESTLVQQALEKRNAPIRKMLQELARISRGGQASWYGQGFVMSMTESAADMANGLSLLRSELKSKSIPLIPLFENQKALSRASEIVKTFFKKEERIKRWQEHHQSQFEVMLGYSDSSKESGALFGRYLIQNACLELDKTIRSLKLQPIFFHGSGGSVARGGGSIQEQISWWPESMLGHVKMTIQGEMIQRLFSSPEIYQNQTEHILFQFEKATGKKDKSKKLGPDDRATLSPFVQRCAQAYHQLIHRKDFREVLAQATPYRILTQLKLGSRPSKRSKHQDFAKLRAIPWNLCWTQTRLLLPVWYGLGQSYAECSPEQKRKLKELAKRSDFFGSFLKQLGFSLAKVELPIWRLYLQKSELAPELKERFYKEFEQQVRLAKQCFNELTGEKELLYFRPWLQESIHLRAPMIHPLNILQTLAIERRDPRLLSETVVGIACGMMTTG